MVILQLSGLIILAKMLKLGEKRYSWIYGILLVKKLFNFLQNYTIKMLKGQ